MEQAIKILEGIASSWNGKDDKFTFEGDVYHEEDAHTAAEALTILKPE